MKLFGAEVVLLPKKERGKLILIIAVGIPLAFFVWRQNVRREQSRTQNLAFLHSLRADAIARVTVGEQHGAVLRSVTDSAALLSFVESVQSTEIYEPNHPSYTRTLMATVTLKDQSVHYFTLHTIFPADKTIYIDFVLGGNGKSKRLYNWLQAQHVIQ